MIMEQIVADGLAFSKAHKRTIFAEAIESFLSTKPRMEMPLLSSLRPSFISLFSPPLMLQEREELKKKVLVSKVWNKLKKKKWEEERLRSRGLRTTLIGRWPSAREEMDFSRKPMNFRFSVMLKLHSLFSLVAAASMSMPTTSNFHYSAKHFKEHHFFSWNVATFRIS